MTQLSETPDDECSVVFLPPRPVCPSADRNDPSVSSAAEEIMKKGTDWYDAASRAIPESEVNSQIMRDHRDQFMEYLDEESVLKNDENLTKMVDTAYLRATKKVYQETHLTGSKRSHQKHFYSQNKSRTDGLRTWAHKNRFSNSSVSSTIGRFGTGPVWSQNLAPSPSTCFGFHDDATNVSNAPLTGEMNHEKEEWDFCEGATCGDITGGAELSWVT
ncbi:hypothetical protein BCR39DRAFT_508549 [Naematelia encephala]|uniref:Uncharacterized protein n=1 Tax=Naematelia encephala TaxID=71784 RepID=A0A1Y2AFP7_9TREE|nr:hypothetical protein BCR39DRAFT_508549 [Naematelia encephala]